MKIDLLDIDRFIETHMCKEVKNPIYFNMGNIPMEDGLFSTEIFGFPGSKERKVLFGYINLKRKFVHPVMYKLLTSMDKKIQDVLNGRKYFSVVNGQLVEDNENGKTGVSYFYSIYDDLRFRNTGSYRRENYLELLKKTKKDDIFIDKFLVTPAYSRDYNPSKTANDTIKAVDEINDKYAKLIRYSQSLPDSEGYDYMSSITESSIQSLLYDIYDYYTSSIAKKNGLIQKSLLGKAIDYATRSVISAPRFKSNKWEDNPIRFGWTGVPLSQVIVLFYPFFIKYIQDYIGEREVELSKFKNEKGEEIKVSNLKEQFSEEEIKKLMSLFIKSVESRFNSIMIKADDGNEYPIKLHTEELKRNFTLTDLLFIAAVDICKDKHVYVTRYPIEQYQNIYPSKIKIISTRETKPQKLQDRYLPDYPVVYPDYPADEELFGDTVVPYNGYLQALGGDYDGDTVSLRGVFSLEANKEADRLIWEKKNLLDQMGRNSRKIGNEAVQCVYSLTRD
ncbi:RNA-polymerase beta'-subunit [Bacillus phage vB_BpuM-BpSp]|nr:RNA-polymerase beta'-subunit [Bacillus phage vB_BpuM-BpSp]